LETFDLKELEAGTDE